jgi:RNA polymerase sigma-70 factor (ECF subfamily)
LSATNKYSNFSDNDLINTFLEKDDNAMVGILYERYGHLVLGLCIKYLKNKDEAQDAVIQIFTNLLKDLKKQVICLQQEFLPYGTPQKAKYA